VADGAAAHVDGVDAAVAADAVDVEVVRDAEVAVLDPTLRAEALQERQLVAQIEERANGAEVTAPEA